MHFIVTAIGSHGDINPMLMIASELKERGHDVDFLANAYFADKVSMAGVDHIELGDLAIYEKAVEDPDMWDARKGFAAIWKLLREVLEMNFERIKEYAVPGKTRLVGSTLAFGSRLAQEKLDLKMASIHLSPSVILSACDPLVIPGLPMPKWLPLPLRQLLIRSIDHFLLDKVCKSDINRVRHELKLSPVAAIMSTWCHSPDLVICAFPDWFATPQPDWPKNTITTGFPRFNAQDGVLDSKLEEFIDSGAPPLVFTAGSAMAHSTKFFETAIKTAERLQARAILVNAFQYQVPESLPENIIHQSYAPFGKLFPRASVVVHHGGIGTSAQSLAAATPQMVVPFAHDQFDNASRLSRLGVAKTTTTIDPDIWTNNIGALLDNPNFAKKCAHYSNLITSNQTPEKQIADTLEKL
ncbi:MAG: glycosyltransferase [Candidatus Obscuribacterales bacterium]|nr:glycosyltransferase [Candidatus Obscuribacterales bacterium]